MQTVNILRDDGRKLSGFFEFCELFVRGIRLRIQIEHLIAVKAEKLFRIPLIKRMA